MSVVVRKETREGEVVVEVKAGQTRILAGEGLAAIASWLPIMAQKGERLDVIDMSDQRFSPDNPLVGPQILVAWQNLPSGRSKSQRVIASPSRFELRPQAPEQKMRLMTGDQSILLLVIGSFSEN